VKRLYPKGLQKYWFLAYELLLN